MKWLIFTSLATFSLSVISATHFECYKNSGNKLESQASRYLIPVEADLTSGAIFASIQDEKVAEDFDYLKTTKSQVLMSGKDGAFLKIENKGLKRDLLIRKLGKDGRLRIKSYICFEESSI